MPATIVQLCASQNILHEPWRNPGPLTFKPPVMTQISLNTPTGSLLEKASVAEIEFFNGLPAVCWRTASGRGAVCFVEFKEFEPQANQMICRGSAT
jgi:hypothetical protein